VKVKEVSEKDKLTTKQTVDNFKIGKTSLLWHFEIWNWHKMRVLDW
jgi:hypothetical protein